MELRARREFADGNQIINFPAAAQSLFVNGLRKRRHSLRNAAVVSRHVIEAVDSSPRSPLNHPVNAQKKSSGAIASIG